MNINLGKVFLRCYPRVGFIPGSVNGFKSAISLDKLYPNSSLDISKEVQIPDNQDQFTGYIPLERLKVSYMCSSGPGGQNVNKVNSKVDIRFRVDEANWLPDTLKCSLKDKHGHLLTASGDLVVRSDKTRSQHLNLADALDKMRATLHSAVTKPPALPDHYTIELHRRRHEKKTRERLRDKRQRTDIKQSRGSQ